MAQSHNQTFSNMKKAENILNEQFLYKDKRFNDIMQHIREIINFKFPKIDTKICFYETIRDCRQIIEVKIFYDNNRNNDCFIALIDISNDSFISKEYDYDVTYSNIFLSWEKEFDKYQEDLILQMKKIEKAGIIKNDDISVFVNLPEPSEPCKGCSGFDYQFNQENNSYYCKYCGRRAV